MTARHSCRRFGSGQHPLSLNLGIRPRLPASELLHRIARAGPPPLTDPDGAGSHHRGTSVRATPASAVTQLAKSKIFLVIGQYPSRHRAISKTVRAFRN